MLNTITIMGRLTRDPELRRTGSGVAVASFCLAVDRDYNPKDGGERETDFIDVTAWRGTAEFISKYFTKGSMAIVSGRLQIRNWTDKDGNKRRSAEVVADSVYFGESRKSDRVNPADQATNGYPGATSDFAETEAMIARYTGQGQNEFAMLEDDDPRLPF
jgi:single-strand DNA-binding protein